MVAPVVLKPEQVPEDLICSICMTLPLDPILTPCEHIFCRGCIHQALEGSNQCPIDRMACTTHQLRTLAGCIFRVWGSIPVKCGNHSDGCAWTGSIGDYANHTHLCSRGRSSRIVSALQGKLDQLEEENSKLKEELQSFQSGNAILLRTLYSNRQDDESSTATLKQENAQLKEQLQNSKIELRSRPNLPGLFTGTYNFTRYDVVQLSQLISRYLENKPKEIDSNQIYNCVQSCYRDLDSNYRDNPQHYHLDMKMLLVTCEASTWFTVRQRENMRGWYGVHF